AFGEGGREGRTAQRFGEGAAARILDRGSRAQTRERVGCVLVQPSCACHPNLNSPWPASEPAIQPARACGLNRIVRGGARSPDGRIPQRCCWSVSPNTAPARGSKQTAILPPPICVMRRDKPCSCSLSSL